MNNKSTLSSITKLKVFLDTSVFVRLLSGHKELLKLFSEKILSQVTYVTSPIVFQELILAASRTNKQVDLDSIIPYVDIVNPNIFDKSFQKELQNFRNRVAHSNDVLIMSTVREVNSDYLLTYDQILIKESADKKYKAMPPEEFLSMIE
ncbi:PIN domain-containing protein [Iningainema tapete]